MDGSKAEIVAEKVGNEIERICKKYNCEIGVWLNWRDLMFNFDQLKKDPTMNELKFGLEIRIHEEVSDTAHSNNKGKPKRPGGGK